MLLLISTLVFPEIVIAAVNVMLLTTLIRLTLEPMASERAEKVETWVNIVGRAEEIAVSVVGIDDGAGPGGDQGSSFSR